MMDYYNNKYTEYKKNTKCLWEVINRVVGKTKHSGKIIPYITIDGIKTYDTKLMATEFGRFYANMGKDLANKIKQSSKASGDYISRI